ncbi:Low molecular weight protein-tyrosine-phosphatase YfkJ [Porphyridium purpureum]|uniref:protein-tyrosine-phosphatase n=1 Tax=Porphyridium purpureum TaxID=35688 RepID=A0A5J4YUN8_PORPP|nr:Low molecular weight protein-tyrosine-phosphatase YfkJ [Porphyridium purpureum]|eukprot:POR3135..scf227_4
MGRRPPRYWKSVLFVGFINSHRSAAAEWILRTRYASPFVTIRSAGTHGFHWSHGADSVMIKACLFRNIDLTYHVAKKVYAEDIMEYDIICAMDSENLRDVKEMCQNENVPQEKIDSISLLLPKYAPQLNLTDVPNPAPTKTYARVIEMIDAAVRNLAEVENLRD